MNTDEKRRKISSLLAELDQKRRLDRSMTKDVSDGDDQEAIAITGIAAKLPSCSKVEDFWQKLEQGECLIEPIAGRRAELGLDLKDTFAGLQDDIFAFDYKFFKMLPEEAKWLDPQVRQLLMSVYHCLEDAGYPTQKLKGQAVGVFVGVEDNEYQQSLRESGLDFPKGFAQASSMIANLISYHFDLRGPSEFVNTMCSSGAVALHRAVGSLRRGEVSHAVVAGVNLMIRPEKFEALNELNQLSSDGVVKPFGLNARGYVRGEATVSLVLTTRSKADKDGDQVYGLIRNTAINYNGRGGMSIASPDAKSHTDLIERCYREAGVDVGSVKYIEAQGMANPLTDIVEWKSFNDALENLAMEQGAELDPSSCAISTLKPMTGHLHAASALGAVLKVIRSFQTLKIYPVLGFDKVSEDIQQEGKPCTIADKVLPWEDSTSQRCAGIHSFGSGGNNAHLVLQETSRLPSKRTISSLEPFIIPLSATDADALLVVLDRLKEFIKRNEPDMVELAYSLQMRRSAMDERLVFVARSPMDLLSQMSASRSSIQGMTMFSGNCAHAQAPLGTFLTQSLGHDFFKQRLEQDPEKVPYLMAEFWALGGQVDFSLLYPNGTPRYLRLPLYPFKMVELNALSETNRRSYRHSQTQPNSTQNDSINGFIDGLSEAEMDAILKEHQENESSHQGDAVGDKVAVSEPLAILKGNLRDQVAEVFCRTLGLETESFSEHKPFSEYGLDSINAAHLIHLLDEELNIMIPPKWIFDYPSFSEIWPMLEHRANERTSMAADYLH